MTTTKPNIYSHSKVYKIVSDDGYFYIGSTTNTLCRRLQQHKASSKLKSTSKAYVYFNSINWRVKIILIQEFSLDNVEQLRREENAVIQQFITDPKCLNSVSAVMDVEKRKESIREFGKCYYEKNKEIVRCKHREYDSNHKEERHLRYEQNKTAINQRKNEKIMCECGSVISRSYKSEHMKTQSHNNKVKATITE